MRGYLNLKTTDKKRALNRERGWHVKSTSVNKMEEEELTWVFL